MGVFMFANNARSKLASAIASGDTSCDVLPGDGAEFPSPTSGFSFRATIADSTNNEIVDITARSTDTLTITRAQEGTSAHDFAAGATIALLVTKEVGEAFFQRGEIDTDNTLAGNSDTKLSSQKAIKTYVDSKVAGLSWKQEVRAATTTAGTLASSFANGSVIDGVTLATGDRILIKNQATGSENGIYVVAASGAPTRATDADSGAELVNAACFVSEGTTLAETVWVCSNNATITVGSTSLTFVQFGAGVSNLSALSDVTITSPANGDVLTYNSGASKWENAGPSSGASRATVTKTTASLANNAVENGTVTLAKSGNLYQLIVDRACRVVLYATSADRTADAARLLGTPATPGTGVLCEFAPTASGTTDCGPAIVYYNGDGSPTSSIYYAITNLSGATHTVQVQFVHLGLES